MRFHSQPIEEHEEVPLADDGRWEELITHWSRRQVRIGPTSVAGRNACYVVSVDVWQQPDSREARLAEILGLVRAQGDHIAGHETLQRARPDPRTFLGRGASEDVAARATACGADMLVIDAELSPSQTRNLEDVTGFAVCDREAVILNVFARHARTRKARIQVEIAHLEYLRPRIRGLGLDMDQQAGGIMRARGPGETASELLARRLDGRLVELRKAFRRLQRSGEIQRKGRDTCRRIALVGYTNAGKTSLMNALTSAGLSARDRPFETLDTTSRCLTRHGGDVLLSDTVGFIRRLPERLLASFESTLAEMREASLLALVVDGSDPEWLRHLEIVEALLVELQAATIPRFYIINKRDRMNHIPTIEALERVSQGHPHALLSSREPSAVAQLKERLLRAVRTDQGQAELEVPYQAAALIARIYASCRVLRTDMNDDGLLLTVAGDAHIVAELRRAVEEVQA